MAKRAQVNNSVVNNSHANRRRIGQRHYSRDEKIAAVTAARLVGRDHPLSIDAVQAARDAIGSTIALQTLSNWFVEYGPIVDATLPNAAVRPAEIVIAEARDNVLGSLANIRTKTIEHLLNSDAINKSSARDAAVVMGIANDHIIKMTDIDPAVATIIKRLAELCQRTNVDIVGLLEDFESVVQAQLPSIQITARQIPDKISDR